MFKKLVTLLALLPAPLVASDLATEISIAGFETRDAFQDLGTQSGSDARNAALKRLITAQEDTIEIMRAAIRRLSLSIRSDQEALQNKEQLLSQAVGALVSINASPAPLLVLNPGGADGTAHAALIFETLVPELAAQITKQNALLIDRQTLLDQWVADAALAKTFHRNTQSAQIALNTADAARVALPENYATSAAAVSDMTVFDLATNRFFDTLSDTEKVNTTAPTIPKGGLRWPVPMTDAPQIQSSGVGSTKSIGAIIETNPFQRVTSPSSGTVIFAAPFMDEGDLVMIEPMRDMLILISGLSRSLVTAGDIVNKGDWIGLIGPTISQDSDLISTTQPVTPVDEINRIYLEVHFDGTPNDPLEWFEPVERK
ncbi:MAG: peptidoglycan DD-metalloendopeptidase family protein [Pseudomonadota bacterium]